MKTDLTGFSPCDYVTQARDNHPQPLTRPLFEAMLKDYKVRNLCKKVREHTSLSEKYKISLPAITWQAKFSGKPRTDQNAIPTGLFCIDVDIHHDHYFRDLFQEQGPEAAYAWAEKEAHERALRWTLMQEQQDAKGCTPDEDLSILAIHISPSGTGVHVVACCNEACKSIADNQNRLAQLLHTEFDPVCKDWARIFFVVPREDWYYIDMPTLFNEQEKLNPS